MHCVVKQLDPSLGQYPKTWQMLGIFLAEIYLVAEEADIERRPGLIHLHVTNQSPADLQTGTSVSIEVCWFENETAKRTLWTRKVLLRGKNETFSGEIRGDHTNGPAPLVIEGNAQNVASRMVYSLYEKEKERIPA